jgi:hypothetical protein
MADNFWNYGKLLTLWIDWRHYVSRRAVWSMRENLWFVSSWRQLSAPLAVCSQLTVRKQYVMVRYTLSNVYFSMTHMKYGSARKCRLKFRRKFRDERVSSGQKNHNLMNKIRSNGALNRQETKTLAPSAYWAKVRWHGSQTWTYTYKITETSSARDWSVKVYCKKGTDPIKPQ